MIAVTLASLVLCLAVLVYAISCWRQRKMAYFAVLSLAITLNVLGYYLEVSVPINYTPELLASLQAGLDPPLTQELQAALVACKVAYLGAPFTGLMFFLFSLEFSGRIHLSRVLRNLLIGLAFLFTASVFLYPAIPLFYEDLSFSAQGLVPHLVVTPGPLYYPCFIYVTVFTVIAFINLMVSFIKERRYEGAAIFITLVLVPMCAQLYTLVFGMIDGWNPVRSAMTVSLVLLCVYMVRYRQAEWQSTGREVVVRDMEDAFILMNNKGVVIDSNLSAESYFPALKSRTRLCTMTSLWDFPEENYLNYGTYHVDMQREDKTLNLKVTTSPLGDASRRTGTLVLINNDTANNQMLQELGRLARLDELTGLNNRATFFRDATLSFDLSQRRGEILGCALMIDIDFFKKINDSYGHATGDKVLSFMGSLLLNRFRRTDILGRYGGEEMVVWMPDTSLEGAMVVAEEIRSAVEAHAFEYEGARFSVTISIGIASVAVTRFTNFEGLVNKADAALYRAKNTGRNRLCIHQEPGLEPATGDDALAVQRESEGGGEVPSCSAESEHNSESEGGGEVSCVDKTLTSNKSAVWGSYESGSQEC